MPGLRLRCRVLGHRWESVDGDGEKGWKCRNCDEFLPEREIVERVHDPEITDPPPWAHGSRGGGAADRPAIRKPPP